MEKRTVTAGMRNATVELDGAERAVKFSDNYRCFEVMNDSDDDVYMSIYQGKKAGDDGVITVHPGMSATIAHMRTDIDTVYVTGSGTVQVAAKDTAAPVFKVRSRGGENKPSAKDYVQDGLIAEWDWDNSDVEKVTGTSYGTSNAEYVYDDLFKRYVGNVVKGESNFYRTNLPLPGMTTYENFTLQCLVKIKQYMTNDAGIFGIGRNNEYGAFQLGAYANGLFAVERANGQIRSDFYFELDEWYHIAATYSSGSIFMFVNGKLVGSGYANINPSTGNLSVGVYVGYSGNSFNQNIANCCVYKRALMPTEIAENYNVDRVRYGIGG